MRLDRLQDATPIRRPSRLRRSARPVSGERPADAAAGDLRTFRCQGNHTEVHYVVQRVGSGLYVEREERPDRGLHNIQYLRFTSPAAFVRWCDRDPVRFEHPRVHIELVRTGEELFCGRADFS